MNLLPADFDPTLLFVALGIAVFFLMLFLAMRPVVAGDRKAKRRVADMLERHRPTVEGQQAQAIVRREAKGGAEKLAQRVLPNQEQLRERLARTGRSISLGRYLLVSAFSGIAGGVIVHAMMSPPLILTLAAVIVAGIGLPYLAVGQLGSRRINRFNNLFPDAIDLIQRGLKSGLPPSESFRTVANEMEDPVGIEFQKIADGLRVGQTPEQVLWEAAKRLNTAEFKFFVISLSIQRETGGNLIETLSNLSNVLRSRRQLKLKVRAMSAEARASAMIIGSLPFVMYAILRVLSPTYVAALTTDPRGIIMTGAGLLSITVGVLVMAKMVNFEH
ncbi:type II secretion system F family protein [Desertibaculum subflavum]|uniref:type II secretion system F family protein n=1 Tax=Desertibaculum subflavum TaxID=2268458 RepID=UPI000E66DC60